MTSMEKQLKCFYLDSELKPASDMLRQCVGDNNSPYRFNCEEDPMKQVLPEDVKDDNNNDAEQSQTTLDF